MATEVFFRESENGTQHLKTAAPNNKRIVSTLLNYYDDPGDGSPPAPVVVGGQDISS
jgi:hypothetical protein